MTNIKGIQLAWITVKNIEKAIEFYTKVVGLTLKEYHKDFRWAELTGPDGAILGIGEDNEKNESPVKAGGNAVVCVTVQDLDKAQAHFIKEGATLLGGIEEIPGHVRMQTFQDKDGNTMQLVQTL
jgi:predicted enzyme related to lactoylglutathione lyase